MLTDSLQFIPTIREPSLVSAVRRLVAGAESFPDVGYITISLQRSTTFVTLAVDSDDAARRMIAELGLPVRTVSHEGHTWLTATYHAAGIELSIAGPQRKEENK